MVASFLFAAFLAFLIAFLLFFAPLPEDCE